MYKCNNCGTKQDFDSVYCVKCGHKLDMPAPSKNNKTNYISDKTVLLIVLSFVLAVLVLGLILVLIIGNRDNTEYIPAIENVGSCEYNIEVEPSFNFGVVLTGSRSSVNVLEENNEVVNVTINSEFDNTYIYPPLSGYNPNKTYKIYLENGKFLNEEYNDKGIICFKIKNTVEDNLPSTSNEELFIGYYSYNDNYLNLKENNTFELGYNELDNIVKITGTYKIENLVLTLNSDDKEYTFNILEKYEISNIEKLGSVEIGSVFSIGRG